jgi:D-alanyl-D-alanine carboxypeptidase
MATDRRGARLLPTDTALIGRRRFLRQAAMAGVAVSVPCLTNSSTAFGKEKPHPSKAAKCVDAALDRALRKLVAMRGGPPGVIAIVQRGEDLRVHRFGVANLRDNRPMRMDDHMRVASVAKAFSGATALSLVSRSRLSLKDTIGEWLPYLSKRWHPVTLRELLNHTSGLPDFSKDKNFQRAVGAHPRKAPLPRKLLSYVEDEPLGFEPGTRYEYSNSDNVAVGLMIQAVTRDTYENQLEKQVLRVLGLHGTSLPAGYRIPKPFIHGYDNNPSQHPPEDLSEILAAGWAWAAGGIVSTPADLNRFIRGYVGGRLFDSRTKAQQRRVVKGGSSEPPGPGKNAAGLGIFRYETKCGTVWGHTGNTPGYTQFAAASADGRRSVTVSVNEQLNASQGAPGVFEALRRAEELAVCAALAT